MTKFVGFEKKSGTFTSASNEKINYDNVIVYIVEEDKNNNVTGLRSEQFKIKTSDLVSVFGTNDLTSFLDREIEIKCSISNMKISVTKVYLV